MSFQAVGKLLMIMFTINLVLYFVQFADENISINKNMVDRIVKVRESGGMQSTMQSTLNSTQLIEGTSDYNISVWGFIKLIFGEILSFLFAPVTLLTVLQAPFPIIALVAVAWGVGYLFTIAGVIWRY